MTDRFTYSNVVATVALFLSLGAGAYAAGIGRNDVKSRHIADGTIKSRDVGKNALTGQDIHDESLDFKEIREDRLDVSQFARVVSNSGACDPRSMEYVDCASVDASGDMTNDLLVIAAGGQSSEGGPASGRCRITIDGALLDEALPGEASSDNSDLTATNGFAVTAVGRNIRPGSHIVALQCNQTSGDTRFGGSVSVLILDAT